MKLSFISLVVASLISIPALACGDKDKAAKKLENPVEKTAKLDQKKMTSEEPKSTSKN